MNRIIKFRVWHNTYQKMYAVQKIEFPKMKITTENGQFYTSTLPHLKEEVFLMQFTGLKDKNDREVYEGDIVSRQGFRYKHKYVVIFDNGGFWLESNNYSANMIQNVIEDKVVGNIYENPILIEEVENHD